MVRKSRLLLCGVLLVALFLALFLAGSQINPPSTSPKQTTLGVTSLVHATSTAVNGPVTIDPGPLGGATVISKGCPPCSRSSFYTVASGLYWQIYVNGGKSLVWASSADGSTWTSSPTEIDTAGLWEGSFAVWYDSAVDRVFIAWASGDAGNRPIYFQQGQPEPNGTIAFDADRQTALAGASDYTYYVTSIVDDSSGHPFIGYISGSAHGPFYYTPYVTWSSNTNGVWVTATGAGAPHALGSDCCRATPPYVGGKSIILLNQSAGKVYALYARQHYSMNGTQWNGSSWAPQEIAMASARVVREEMYGGAVSLSNDDIVVSMLTSGPRPHAPLKILVVRRFASNSSWSNPVTVISNINDTLENAPGPSVPSISRDGNDLYLFWMVYPAADTGFFTYYDSTTGTWDRQPTFFFTDGWLNDPEIITSWFSATAGRLGMVYDNWLASSGSNQQLRFISLKLPFTRYTVNFTSSGIGSDTGDNAVVTVGATGHSMAGITLNESQLPYSGLFYSNFQATYNYSSSVAGAMGVSYAWLTTSGCSQTTRAGTIIVSSGCTVTGAYTQQGSASSTTAIATSILTSTARLTISSITTHLGFEPIIGSTTDSKSSRGSGV